MDKKPTYPAIEDTDLFWTTDPFENDETLERFIEDERISFREEWFLYLEEWEP